MNGNTTRAVTLVEILVVVGVIAVLMAILLPVYASARRSARVTSCSSNLHQIGLAMQMYESDWDRYPLSFLDLRKLRLQIRPGDPLEPYTKNADIYHCPESPEPDSLHDYAYRVSSFWPPRVFQPEPENVLLYCYHHVQDEHSKNPTGQYVILRAHGSVHRYPAERIVYWQLKGDKWHPPGTPPILEASRWHTFPPEPWPPQFAP